MLAEVVFRNVVTQRSTQVSMQLCLSSWKASGDSGLEFPVLRIFFSYSTRPKASTKTLRSKIEGHLKILANLYHFTKNQIHSVHASGRMSNWLKGTSKFTFLLIRGSAPSMGLIWLLGK